jgi:putative spermidine/putrescine transport system substrate-binding protein
MKRWKRWGGALAILAVMAMIATACSSSSSSSSSASGGGSSSSAAGGITPPEQNTAPLTSIGQGEGKLNIIAWEGYLDPMWVKPFEQQTGCQVNAKYAGSSDEMVTLMANGGGGQYDLVSASGDADLRLIYNGDVKPVNMDLIPSWKDLLPQLQSPPFNTINDVHYGVSLQWGPNTLMYNTDKFSTPPDSWAVLYDQQYSGKITVPNNPIQIADAALYLSKTQPNLGITDPYELTQDQFNAAIDLLKQQAPLVKKYWGLASQEISLFKNGDVDLGAGWSYTTGALQAAGAPVAETVPPSQGATGWADTYLLATNAPDPNCAYKWMDYITQPKPQAQQGVTWGETPANPKACPIMDSMSKGSCAAYHLNAPASYFDSIAFWKTPLADCGNGQTDCVPYDQWVSAWNTEITG